MAWLIVIGVCTTPTWARSEGTGTIIDFEDLTLDPADPYAPVPDGYEGFTWHGVTPVDATTGAYDPGAIGDITVVGWVHLSSTVPFRFDGAWITAPGWGLTAVWVGAYDGSTWTYEAVYAGGDRAYWFAFDWEGVTELLISGEPSQIIVDDIYINMGPDVDSDGDGVGDRGDSCTSTANADQADADGDRVGDACEEDDDADGVLDAADGCVTVPDADQADADMDGAGDACDACPDLADDQADADGDGDGDACDDLYGRILNFEDLEPVSEDEEPTIPEGYGDLHWDGAYFFRSGDGWTDIGIRGEVALATNYVLLTGDDPFDVEGAWFGDLSGEGAGVDYWGYDDDGNEISGGLPFALEEESRWVTLDLHDVVYLEFYTSWLGGGSFFSVDDLHIDTDTWSDSDGDGVDDRADRCPTDYDPDQEDLDDDFVGDACDSDWDGDEVPNDTDLCPEDADVDQADTDADWVGDVCDNCPDTPNTDQANADPDHFGDACDTYDGVTVDFEDLDPGVESDEIAIPEDYLGLTWTTDATAVTAGSPTYYWGWEEGINGNVALLLPRNEGSRSTTGWLYLTGDSFSLLGLQVCATDAGAHAVVIVEEWRDGAWEQAAASLQTEIGEAAWFDLDLIGVSGLRFSSDSLVILDDLYVVLPDDDADGVADGADNCPSDTNADQSDFDGDEVGDTCDDDDDDDVVDDDLDLCPGTPAASPVTGDGCDARQYVEAACPSERPWPIPGAYVRCVAGAANRAVELGVATPAQRQRFIREAADGPTPHRPLPL